MASKDTLISDLERRTNLIDTLYHHSDLSVKAISYQVDMNVKQVQKIIDRLRKSDALDILVEQSKTSVAKIMTRNVITLDYTKTVHDAAVLMAKKRVGCVVVTTNGKPYGIITERDIVKGIGGTDISIKNATLEEFASRPLVYVEAQQSIEEIAEIMIKNKIRKLPVVQGEKLVGIVTVTDLAMFLSPTRRPGLAESILHAVSRDRRNRTTV